MTLIIIIIAIGVPSIIVALIYIGRKLQILDDLQRTMSKMKVNIKVISDFLTRNYSEFNLTELHGYSALQLTEEGRRFLYNIGFMPSIFSSSLFFATTSTFMLLTRFIASIYDVDVTK